MSICTFASNRVQKVDASKGTSNERVDLFAGTVQAHSRVTSDMGKDILLANLNQG
jgi:hypothetical protein